MSINVTNGSMKLEKVEINSTLVGILLIANLISNTISLIIKIPYIFAIIVVLISMTSIIKTGIKIAYSMLFLILIIITQFIMSFLWIESSMTNRFFISFVSIGISSIIVSSKPFNIFRVTEIIQLFALFCSPYMINIFLTDYSIYDAGALMGIGYAILPVIISAILVLFNAHRIKWKVIAIINLALSISVSVKLISRGFFISILCFVVLFIFYKIRTRPINILKISIIMILLLVVYLVFFREKIIASDWYYYLFLLKSENFLNGRSNDILNIIQPRPIINVLFGSGIGSYHINFGEEYIHNIIGMVYYEQGILLSIILLYVLIFPFIKFFTSHNEEYKILVLFLYSVSIIRLMVSYYFWIEQAFWIFITVMLNSRYLFSFNSEIERIKFYDESISNNTNV